MQVRESVSSEFKVDMKHLHEFNYTNNFMETQSKFSGKYDTLYLLYMGGGRD